MINLFIETFYRLKEIILVLFQDKTPTNIYDFKHRACPFLNLEKSESNRKIAFNMF